MARERGRRKFGKLKNEHLKQHTDRSSGGFDRILRDGISIWTPKEGKRTVRLLPWSEAGDYGFPIHVHYDVGPDKSRYLCPAKMEGKPCPICDERAELANEARRTEDEDAAAAARSLSPSQSIAVLMLDRDAEEDGPQVWLMPVTKVDKEIALRAKDPDTGAPLQIHDLDEGYDISFRREGKGLKTDYVGIEIARRPSPALDDEDKLDDLEAWLEKNPLDEMFIIKDYEYLNKIWSGKTSRADEEDDASTERSRSRYSDDDDDGDDDAPRSRRTRHDRDADDDDEAPRRRRRSRDDDDDADDDVDDARDTGASSSRDEEEDDDDVAEQARRASERLSRRGSRAKLDEDDEEKTSRRRRGRDDDDAEPDDEPRRRRRR